MIADPRDDASNPLPAESARDDILRLWRAFAPLDIEVRARALRAGRVEHIARDAVFRPEGEVAVVVSGCLLLHVDGTALCAGVAGPGDLVDLGGGACGRWVTSGEVYRVVLATFLGEAGDAGWRFLLTGADRRRRSLERRLACGTAHSSLRRVASLLLEIDAACGRAEVPLRQSDLAALLSVRRAGVNAACQTLGRAGAVRSMRGRTLILDRARLQAFACCAPVAGAPVAASATDPAGAAARDGGEHVGVAA